LSTFIPQSPFLSLTPLFSLSLQVYIVDKTEANPLKVKNHPAWASEITLDSGAVRPMDVYSNSFCAGGNYLGDGRLINVGGNEGITTGGFVPSGTSQPAAYGGAPYYDYDGGAAYALSLIHSSLQLMGLLSIRLLTPCANQTCNWIDNPKNYMTSRRWYPTMSVHLSIPNISQTNHPKLVRRWPMAQYSSSVATR